MRQLAAQALASSSFMRMHCSKNTLPADTLLLDAMLLDSAQGGVVSE